MDMNNPVDMLLAQMSVGQTASLALELVEDELQKDQYQTDMKVYELCNSGTLTPEKAMNFWFKKHALYTLHTRLKQKMNVGRSSAEKAAEILEFDENG